MPTLTETSRAVALVSLAALVFLAGVGAGYQFDDASSVLPLTQLRDSPELFWDLVLNDRSGPLGRPVSIFSFAVEQALFQAGPGTNQVVSVLLHAGNTVLVFLLSARIFREEKASSSTLLAISVALLWALAPQKVSTVLYITQRMTILATTFVLLTLLFYLWARQSHTGFRQRALLLLALASAAIAPFAKETGLLAIPCAAALEVFATSKVRNGPGERAIRGCALGILGLGVLVFIGLGFFVYQNFTASFAVRSFEYSDRLLSAPGILLDYARQFILPDVGRMGVLHDDYPLLGPDQHPIVFYGATFVILGLSCFMSFVAVSRRPSPLAAGLAIFFIGHSLESFYFPLELYFEHRNYLPSVGLAIAAVGVVRQVATRWPSLKVLLKWLMLLYLSTLAALTVSLCIVWRDADALLAHHLSGHERSSRANAEISFVMAKAGQIGEARTHLRRSIAYASSEPAAKPLGGGDYLVLDLVLACLSDTSFRDLEFLDYSSDSLTVAARYDMHSASLRALRTAHDQQHCPNADWALASELIQSFVVSGLESGRPRDWHVLRDLVALERALGHPLKVFVYAQMAIELNPSDGMLHLAKLEAAAMLGDSAGVDEAVSDLASLEAQGKLLPMERRLLQVALNAIESAGGQ